MQQPDYLISTPENVDLHLELAGLGNRIYACFIDTIITYASLLMLFMFTLLTLGITTFLPISLPIKTFSKFAEIGVLIFASTIIIFGYYIFFEGIWQGQTPGKRLAGIRVIEQNGQPVAWPAIIIRNLLRTVDIAFSLIGILVMFIDKNERRLGDLAAGTLVIRESLPQRTPVNLDIKADFLERSSTIDVGRLTPQEYDVLLSYLQRRSSLAASQKPLVAQKLEHYFRARLNQPVDGQSTDHFLETIYATYQARSDS